MSNSYFQFKQFTINQHCAAMKVGTDGVLLGAWARLDGTERRILDIGTGTGLIALMSAQRAPEACVDAVEIDPSAAKQAQENAHSSPWPQRIRIHNLSIQKFTGQKGVQFPYDHILSNPPFFVSSLKAPDASRRTARHADTLSCEELAIAVNAFLTEEGRFSVIYPPEEAAVFERAAHATGLFCNRKTWVRGTPESVFKRVLMEFSRRETALQENDLTIEWSRHHYTLEYIELTRDFYLNL